MERLVSAVAPPTLSEPLAGPVDRVDTVTRPGRRVSTACLNRVGERCRYYPKVVFAGLTPAGSSLEMTGLTRDVQRVGDAAHDGSI